MIVEEEEDDVNAFVHGCHQFGVVVVVTVGPWNFSLCVVRLLLLLLLLLLRVVVVAVVGI